MSVPHAAMRAMREDVAALAARQYGLISRGQLIELGLSKGAAEHLAVGWEKAQAGVYALPGAGDSYRRRVMAALLGAGRDAVASHETAAFLHRLVLDEPSTVHLSVPRSMRPRLRDVVVHRVTRAPDPWRVGPIRVTDAHRTVCDLVGSMSDDDFELMLDHGLTRRIVSTGRLRWTVGLLPHHEGRGRLIALLEERGDGRPRVQSRLEQRLHELLESAGITGWKRQFEVPVGETTYYLDVAFPEARLGLELDGYVHHSTRRDWARDRTRATRIVAQGWRIIRVTKEDLDEGALALVANIRLALGPGSGTFSLISQ